MGAQPRIMRQAIGARLIQIFAHRLEWLEMFLAWSHGCKQVRKAARAGVGFHGLQHPSRMSPASRLREKADFQGTDGGGIAVDMQVFVRPSDHFIPASVGSSSRPGKLKANGTLKPRA